MKLTLSKLNIFAAYTPGKLPRLTTLLLLFFLVFFGEQVFAQGTWIPLTNLPPSSSGGEMVLLSDGSVLCKTFAGGTDGYGNLWNKLTPDATGSYTNGTWSTIAPMHNTRLYFSAEILNDGRFYVAGGEYGSGGSAGETYDPVLDTWTDAPPPGARVSDANSEILPDGRVIQALVSGSLRSTLIFDPGTNTYATGPDCQGIHNESAWVRLPDRSILFVDRESTNSERYIPASNTWIPDATVPVDLYDPFGDETGAGFLLPDGRAFFLGSGGHTAYYTPSGNTSQGTWAAGPDIPNSQGTPDAAGAMMVTGNILCAVSPTPTSGTHFPTPTSFYEFNYLTNSFTRVNAPEGGLTLAAPSYITNMLDLPNGNVLYSEQGSSQYYVYKPSGATIAAGKPTLNTIRKNAAGTYRITGTLFNGISEGAAYGDDWQMASNYPIVLIKSSTQTYYGRSYNWNRTRVQSGALKDTAHFSLPAGIPAGSYTLSISVNGFKSNSLPFTVGPTAADEEKEITSTDAVNAAFKLSVYPNPAMDHATVAFTLPQQCRVNILVNDVFGKAIKTVLSSNLEKGDHSVNIITSELSKGVYFVKLTTSSGSTTEKLVVE